MNSGLTTVICATIILIPVSIIIWKVVMAISKSFRDDPGPPVPPFILFDMFLHDSDPLHDDPDDVNPGASDS